MSKSQTAVSAIALWLMLASAALCQPKDCVGDIACTEQGAVRGILEGATLAFKGIPYARPPVGGLRWKPPQSPARWEGVRDGGQYGPMCPQLIGQDVKGSEDCLYINIWRPREQPSRPLPVMIWLTGGGNHSLSGEGTAGQGGVVYNGHQLVPQGVVFVSYNLRLGALGFLAHPSLDAERPEKISGNYGSLDQIAMLQWVHRNIGAFGGDPGHVFLFGTSAGGGNICALLTSPLARGLFQGAAMESSVPTGCEIQTLAGAEEGTGRKVTTTLGCDSASDVAACLRAKSVGEIVAAVPGTFTVLPRVYGPNMDGHVFTEQPIKLIERGQYSQMPIIIGNTAGETWPWADTAGKVTDETSYGAALERLFGAAARERIMALYPVAQYQSPRHAFAQATTDAEFTCTSRRVARTLSRVQKEPIYRYLFNHALENDPAQKALGPAHTFEHPFLFAFEGNYRPNETDLAVQREMVGYWTRMAKTANPNSGGDPSWPRATADGDDHIEIGAATAARSGAAGSHCDFWDVTPLLWPHV